MTLTKFTKLDYANCLKYPEVANNKTLQIAFESLTRENTRPNHLIKCYTIVGYLKCMCDLKIISHNVFNDCIEDLHYITNEIIKSAKGE